MSATSTGPNDPSVSSIGIPTAHIGGIPIEETLGSFGPVLVALIAALSARLSALIHNRDRGVT